MNCQECHALVERALDGALRGFTRRRLSLHLSRCADCRAYFDRRRQGHAMAYRALNDALCGERLPPGFARRFRAARITPERRIWPFRRHSRWKAAALLGLLLGGMAFAAHIAGNAFAPSQAPEETEDTVTTEPASAVHAVSSVPFDTSVSSVPSTETNAIPQGETQMNIQATTATVVRTTAKAVAAAALALGAAAPAQADPPPKSVFSDAAIWIKGVYDNNKDGFVDADDLRNAASASTLLPGRNAYGVKSKTDLSGSYSRVHARVDVTCPYANTVISNVPCIHLAQAVSENAETGIGECSFSSFRLANAGSGSAVSVTDCCATVVARIRPDMPIQDRGWLFGGIGFLLGFVEQSSNPGKLMMQGYCGNWQSTSFYVDPGTWLDVAVVPEGIRMKFYAVTNNGTLWKGYGAATPTGLNCGVKEDLYLGLHQVGSWFPTPTNTTSPVASSFRGMIQSFAVWNRKLTEEEIREAFAFPRTDIMRIGLADGAGGEFIEASPDGAPVNSDDWYGMPAALAPGESVDIAFWLKDYEHTLPQTLRLTSAPGSSGGLDVSVNGTAIKKTLKSVPGATKTLFIPGELFLSGSNTLHLANNSSGTVMFDELALGGSWQVGFADDSNSEFGSHLLSPPFYVEDGRWKDFNSVATVRTNTISAIVPVELATSVHPVAFSVRAYTPAAYKETYYPSPMVCQLIVNGEERKSFTLGDYPSSSKHYETFTVDLEAGDLKAGLNTFAIACNAPGAGGNQNYLVIDCWRLEVKDLPKGMVFSFR